MTLTNEIDVVDLVVLPPIELDVVALKRGAQGHGQLRKVVDAVVVLVQDESATVLHKILGYYTLCGGFI